MCKGVGSETLCLYKERGPSEAECGQSPTHQPYSNSYRRVKAHWRKCLCLHVKVCGSGTRGYQEQRASLLGARTLLGAPGLTTRSKEFY